MIAALALASRLGIAVVALAFGAISLQTWIGAGESPLAREWTSVGPMVVCGVLLILLLLGLAMRASLSIQTGGILLFAALANISNGLAPFPSNARFGDGPVLWPVYVLGVLLVGLYLLAGRRLAPDGVRLAALAVFFSAANAKLFDRGGNGMYLLAAASIALALGASPDRFARLRGKERTVVALAFAFVIWVGLAAVLGDSTGRGLRQFTRVAAGALLALALARGGGLRLARHVTLAALFGIAMTCTLWASAWLEAIPYEGVQRVFETRLRLLGMHANGIGPFFGAGACLTVGIALGPRKFASRVALLGLAMACIAGVVLTRSSASAAGMVAGLAAVALLRTGLVPRAAWALPALLIAALSLFAGWFVSPLSEGAREELAAMTQTPSALGQRFYLWSLAGEAIAERPWIGHGPGQSYVHTKYARPSYYDGTAQDLHPHNLWLSVAEGAGIPAALLFTALIFAAFEVGRRLVRAGSPSVRALTAGWLGSLVAILTANLLDLGQSQQTLVPLLMWITLGVLGALWVEQNSTTGEPSMRTLEARGLAPWAPFAEGAWVAFILLAVLLPLSALTLTNHSRIALSKGKLSSAERSVQLGRLLAPFDHRSLGILDQIRARQGRPAQAFEFARRKTLGTPTHAANWLALAQRAFDLEQYGEIKPALQRASELDPRGKDRARVLAMEARLSDLQGNRERAHDQLLETLLNQGNPWESWQLQRVQGDAQLFSGSSRAQGHSLLNLAEEAMQEVRSNAIADPVLARRQVRSVAIATQTAGRPDLAADWLRQVQEAIASDEFVSLAVLETRARCAAGDAERALELLEAIPIRGHPYIQLLKVQCLVALPAGTDQPQIEHSFPGTDQLLLGHDLFLEAGTHAPMIEALLDWKLMGGDAPAALAELHRLRRDLYSGVGRGTVGLRTGSRLLSQDSSVEEGLEALVLGLCDLTFARPRAGPDLPLKVGQRVAELLPGDELRPLGEQIQLRVPPGRIREAFLTGLGSPP